MKNEVKELKSKVAELQKLNEQKTIYIKHDHYLLRVFTAGIGFIAALAFFIMMLNNMA